MDTLTDRNLSLTNFAYTPTGKIETIGYASDPTVSFTYDIRDNSVRDKVIRNYDPCISCATHSLKLRVDRGDT